MPRYWQLADLSVSWGVPSSSLHSPSSGWRSPPSAPPALALAFSMLWLLSSSLGFARCFARCFGLWLGPRLRFGFGLCSFGPRRCFLPGCLRLCLVPCPPPQLGDWRMLMGWVLVQKATRPPEYQPAGRVHAARTRTHGETHTHTCTEPHRYTHTLYGASEENKHSTYDPTPMRNTANQEGEDILVISLQLLLHCPTLQDPLLFAMLLPGPGLVLAEAMFWSP